MNVLIVDDEQLARERLKHMLAKAPEYVLIGEVDHGLAALKIIAEQSVDCVLLDVVMPGMDGLKVAEQIAQQPNHPVVIFCTTHDEHALAAFNASAIDYVLKPVRKERLFAALEKAQRFRSAHMVTLEDAKAQVRTHVCARIRGDLNLIPLRAISYFQAEDKYTSVHYDQGEVLIEESLKALEEEFSQYFVRIHRNCLVSIDRITALHKNADGHFTISVLHAKEPLEVSRRCLPQIRKIVKSL